MTTISVLAALAAVLALIAVADIDPLTKLIGAALIGLYVLIHFLANRARRGAAWRSRYRR